MFIELGKSDKNRKEQFLKEMEEVIPWEFFMSVISPYYKRERKVQGRKKTDLKTLLKIYMLQQWYGLSDPGVESEIYDSIGFKMFLGLELSEKVPDETTIGRFRHLLEENKLTEELLKSSRELFEKKGLFMKSGTIVDATLIKASSSTKNKEKKRDPEMSSTKKNNNYHFGMKISVGVDADSGVIHTVTGATAKTADNQLFESSLHGQEKAVFGDKGYISQEKKRAYRRNNVFWGVLDKASGKRNYKLSSSQIKRNQKLSTIRAKVEHFFSVKYFQNQSRARYRGIDKNVAQWNMLACLFNFQKFKWAFL